MNQLKAIEYELSVIIVVISSP